MTFWGAGETNTAGWGPVNISPGDAQVPDDLLAFYKNFRPNEWGYVCPCCKLVFLPGLAGMPGTFRSHIRSWLEGKGCFFNPTPPKETTSRG